MWGNEGERGKRLAAGIATLGAIPALPLVHVVGLSGEVTLDVDAQVYEPVFFQRLVVQARHGSPHVPLLCLCVCHMPQSLDKQNELVLRLAEYEQANDKHDDAACQTRNVELERGKSLV